MSFDYNPNRKSILGSLDADFSRRVPNQYLNLCLSLSKGNNSGILKKERLVPGRSCKFYRFSRILRISA